MLRIGSHDRPRIPAAGARRVLRRPRNRVPRPQRLAAAGVERTNNPRSHIHRLIVRNRRSHNHHIANHDRRRREAIPAKLYLRKVQARREVNRPVRAKLRAGSARRSVPRNQPTVQRRHEHTMLRTRPASLLRRVPQRHAARTDDVDRLRVIDSRIEVPHCAASRSIQRKHFVIRRIEKQHSLPQHRRRFKVRARITSRRGMMHRVRMENPGGLQLVDVPRIDLRMRGVPLPAGVATISGPVLDRRLLLLPQGKSGQQTKAATQPQEKRHRPILSAPASTPPELQTPR